MLLQSRQDLLNNHSALGYAVIFSVSIDRGTFSPGTITLLFFTMQLHCTIFIAHWHSKHSLSSLHYLRTIAVDNMLLSQIVSKRWPSLADSSLKLARALGGPKCGAALPILAATCLAGFQLFVYVL